MFKLIKTDQQEALNQLKKILTICEQQIDQIQYDQQSIKDCQSGYLDTEPSSLAFSSCLALRREELANLEGIWANLVQTIQEEAQSLEARSDQISGIINDSAFLAENK